MKGPYEPASFTDLMAWQEAIDVLSDSKGIADEFRGPDAAKAAVQLITAAESISSNIAEGYGKGFTLDNIRYLKIALSSADEVESRLHSAVAAKRIKRERITLTIRKVQRTRSLILGYMRYVDRRRLAAS